MDCHQVFSAFQLAGTILATLLAWRLWRFTILPTLHPNSPREYPYWIPFIGHAGSFFKNFNDAISQARKHFHSSPEPFAITVAGQTLYIATSSEDINAVWNNTKTISMIPISDELYKWAGIGEESRKSMFEAKENAKYNESNAKALTRTQIVQQLHHRQLHRGPRLDDLTSSRVIPSIFRQLDAKHLVEDVSLFELCVQIFITDTTDAYFNPKLREIEPNLISAFEMWEQSNWKFLFQLPGAFARDMLAAKATITNAFTKYYSLPRSERPGAIFFVTELEDLMREAGLSEEEMGAFTLLHYWACVAIISKDFQC